MARHQGRHAKHNKRKAAAVQQARGPGKRKGAKEERDTDVFKRRKFIKNNHVDEEPGKEDEDSSEEEVEDTEYGKLLQVFGEAGTERAAVDSEEEEEDDAASGPDGEDEELSGESGDDEGKVPDSHSSEGSEESDLEEGAEAEVDSADEAVKGDSGKDEVEEEEEEEEPTEGAHEDKDGTDPFTQHVDTDLTPAMVKALSEKSRWETRASSLPLLGLLQVQTLTCLPGPEPVCSDLAGLRLKPKLEANLPASGLTDRQMELLSLMTSYRDLCYTERTQTEGEELRLAYCLHVLNHVLRTRTRILNNNAKHEARDAGEERLRDQGFTRPKVLIVVPFKEAARRVVDCIIGLLFPAGQSRGKVANKKRFDQDYAKVVTARKDKSEDYYDTFEGNIDDSFKLGLSVTKSTLKLYTDFYNSDIIISSPLGLRLVTGVEEQEVEDGAARRTDGDTDFLSSIELLVLDQADVFLMQNWSHLSTVLAQLHRQPKESHGVDFSRVRLWSLDGQARHYRQTLLLSRVSAPELNSVWNGSCLNYRGKVRVANPVSGSGALAGVLSDTPIVWHRVPADSVADSLEKRFLYLTEKIMPQFSRDSMDHTLVFIPSYFDFVRVRNWFKASDLDLAEMSEYSKDKRVAKARDEFYHNEKHFLLYTERAHFFRRFRIKGIRHLVFFQPPTYPGAMTDLCNLQQAAFQNPRGGSQTNMSCTVLYTRYDALRVAQCVGSEPAATMLGAENPVHRFQPS